MSLIQISHFMKRTNLLFTLSLLFMLVAAVRVSARDRYNFNSDWKLQVGDIKGADSRGFKDNGWQRVTLPHAFNEDEAFKVPIKQLTDTVAWYRKHFRLPREAKGKKVFVEFEGLRMGADFYLNGHHLGYHENGVMAVGLDLTPYINYGGETL